MKATLDFESGPIPPYYAKVIDVGPEGEGPNVDIMPTHIALGVFQIDARDHLLDHSRAIIVNHPGGITVITFTDEGRAHSKTFLPETERLTPADLAEF